MKQEQQEQTGKDRNNKDDDLYLRYEKRVEWAKKNIHVGTLVQTTVPFMLNIIKYNFISGGEISLSHQTKPLLSGTPMMFLGFGCMKSYKRNSGLIEELAVDGVKSKKALCRISQCWLIENQVYRCNIHPTYFVKAQCANEPKGMSWSEAQTKKYVAAKKILEEQHGNNDDGSKFMIYLPDYKDLITSQQNTAKAIHLYALVGIEDSFI